MTIICRITFGLIICLIRFSKIRYKNVYLKHCIMLPSILCSTEMMRCDDTMRSLGPLDACVSTPYKINHIFISLIDLINLLLVTTIFGHHGSSSVHPCEANDNFRAQIIHYFMKNKYKIMYFYPKKSIYCIVSHSSFTFFQKWFLLLKTTTMTTTTVKLKDKTNVFIFYGDRHYAAQFVLNPYSVGSRRH